MKNPDLPGRPIGSLYHGERHEARLMHYLHHPRPLTARDARKLMRCAALSWRACKAGDVLHVAAAFHLRQALNFREQARSLAVYVQRELFPTMRRAA